ncbi:hypothetical protein B0A48_01887 [Cryoendolithus antarcticus]|uniref:VLRF1 domain-containing protein n=1 Tax=Cryoendolithus antarcticus TaxID=1507870 RepID=A0A1V8TQV8_9PEZI|nr:hypothetical protein B0A48_01887 [Cryoendolithus antarcticus]
MAQQPVDKLLQRPLYGNAAPLGDGPHTSRPTTPLESSETTNGSSTSATACTLCGQSFPTVLDQRSHVRSDLHAYNLKLKLRGREAVTESEFERLVEKLDESLSGSDTDESDDSDEGEEGGKTKDSTLSALLRRQAKVTNGDAEDAPTKQRKQGAGKAPLMWFTSSKLPSNTSLGVYRAVFAIEEQEEADHLVETLQRKQLAPKPAPKPATKPDPEDEGGVPLPASMVPLSNGSGGPHYFMCMIGGGHFAAMLVSLTPKLTKKAGLDDRAATVIAHKTFHRYTTRRKQGGSQSAKDNTGKSISSAGSSLRRYNEVALETEIRALLQEWRSLIDSADLIFVRASGSGNRRTLFGPYEDQVLTQKDPRLRGFPFNTRRATQAELMRAFVELTRVKVNVVDEAAVARQAEEAATAAAKAQAQAQAASRPSAPKVAKPSKADEEALLHTTQLQALIRRSKAPALLSYLQTHSLPQDFIFFPPDQNRHAPTPLHLAASSNSPACVLALLTKAKADPTVENTDSKYPFDLAGDRATRDAFRLARSQLGETDFSWDTANVPSPLSQIDVDARAQREAAEQAEENAAEKARRQKETERLREEERAKGVQAKEDNFGKGRLLSKPILTAEERRAEDARGMTDEMRIKVERERRARAAEERMRKLAGGR